MAAVGGAVLVVVLRHCLSSSSFCITSYHDMYSHNPTIASLSSSFLAMYSSLISLQSGLSWSYQLNVFEFPTEPEIGWVDGGGGRPLLSTPPPWAMTPLICSLPLGQLDRPQQLPPLWVPSGPPDHLHRLHPTAPALTPLALLGTSDVIYQSDIIFQAEFKNLIWLVM